MSFFLLSRSLGSVVAALALAGPQTVPAPKPADPAPAEGEGHGDPDLKPDLKEESLLRERIKLDEPRAAELRVRFANVARQLRGNVIRLTIERNSGERATVEVSGFVLDPAGHVVTFGSALAQAERVSVRFVNLQGVRPRRARIIGTDSDTDVGVLDVGPIALPALNLGTPIGAAVLGGGGAEAEARIVVSMSGVRGGESAVALGVVDGVGAPLAGGRMFQISIARRPDTFGGIVARCDGAVVAMLYAPAFGGMPEGRMQPMLAVPTGQIQVGLKRVLERATPAEKSSDAPAAVPASAKVSPRTWVGLGASDLGEPEFLRQIDAPGAIVVDEVFEASPALAAGIVPHDVLLKWNGRALRNVDDLSNLLAASAPGSKVVLSCLRGLVRRDVEVTLGAW